MNHTVVSRAQWIENRKQLLQKEKEFTKALDQLNEQRRALPWVKVEKEYVFDTPAGRKTLSELFDGRSQLIVYHFMYGPEMKEGCVGCSFYGDHIDGPNLHVSHHDVTFVAASRAPLATLEAYKKRMGWRFDWVSSAPSDFNYDFGVSFRKEDIERGSATYNFGSEKVTMPDLHGTSVFFKDTDGAIYHTYSVYGRGDERGLGAYAMLDITPKGRQENINGNLTDWVRRHDQYDAAQKS